MGSSTAEEIVERSEKWKGEPALKIFVAGDSSGVGKSSVCLGLLGSLLGLGYRQQDLAYIKPATMCEQKTRVVSWCETQGISCQGIGPIVFYSGFTRAFLSGQVGSSEDLLRDVVLAVDKLSRGKILVVIDGVGYPAVGSICGVSNAAIANSIGAPVLIVAKKGVGDAVDSYNMNAAYFEHFDCPILGCIFNKLPTSGYYAIDKCEANVRMYFTNNGKHALYGFLPELEEFSPEEAIKSFSSRVHVRRLMDDVAALQRESRVGSESLTAVTATVKRAKRASRAEVEEEAVGEGAAPSCRIVPANYRETKMQQ